MSGAVKPRTERGKYVAEVVVKQLIRERFAPNELPASMVPLIVRIVEEVMSVMQVDFDRREDQR